MPHATAPQTRARRTVQHAPTPSSGRAGTGTTGRTARRTRLSPPPTPPTSPPSADYVDAVAWNWGTVYLEGQRAKHKSKLWPVNWWTQGSEPGLTAQWSEVGPCS
ncbi:hypothetical protein E0H50_29100 [Kribbella sindirgiensis]|uniref:Chitin-binding type-3 domain-containing protein n=1 Tax=Kribbella sindirgiensis TaxID=1124744 RepID=A0A4V6N3Y6_9ACTN|nr:hypothetical protein E0H50_29100 [Kribbella sindirgiensis]